MRLIKRLVSRRYLGRLAAMATLIVFIPCLVGIVGVFSISYQQLKRTNDDYHREQLGHFIQLFDEEISEMRMFATQISFDSRTPTKAAYRMQREALLGPAINYGLIFLESLGEYSYAAPAINYGLYYPEYDILFDAPNKFTLSSYLRSLSMPDGSAEFFTADGPQLRFLPYDNPQRGATELFVGVQTTMGMDRDQALFFFQLDRTALNISSILAENTSDAQFCLWNEEGLAYVCGHANMNEEQLLAALEGSAPASYVVHRGEMDKYGFSCAIIVPQDVLTRSLSSFYALTVTIISLTIAMLIGMLIIMIRIIYKPVQNTLDLIDTTDPDEDEFQTINSTLMQMKNEITEQNGIILDHLLSSLLHGTPISEKNIQRTGLVRCAAYQVFVWTDLPLSANERAELVNSLHMQMNATAYVTDLLGREQQIIICRHPSPQGDGQLSAYILRWFEERFQSPPQVMTGAIVPSLDQLHDAYASCFSPAKNTGRETHEVDEHQANVKMQKLRQEVEEYLKNNYSDSSLSQITISDHFGISAYSLSRLFNNLIGISFAQYITNLRLTEAKRLLLESEMPVNDIAREIGMTNPNYFSRVFKQNFGVTPMQFRKQR